MKKRRTYQKRGKPETSKLQSQRRPQNRTPFERSSVHQERMQWGGEVESRVNLWEDLQAELQKKERQLQRQPRPKAKTDPRKNQGTGKRKPNQTDLRPWPGMPTDSQQKKRRSHSQAGVQSGQWSTNVKRSQPRRETGRSDGTWPVTPSKSQQRGALPPKQHPKRKKRKHYRVKTRFKVLMITLCVVIVASFNYVLSPLVGSNTETNPSDDKAQPAAAQTPVGTQEGQSTGEGENQSTENTKVDKSSEYLKLVNKTHAVGSREEPEDLVRLKTGTKDGVTTVHDQLRRVPAKHFVQLVKGGKAAGLEFIATSAYRPYTYQKALHERYASKDGAVKANTYSAKPGYSEHETGLCLDVSSPSVGYSLTEDYGTTKEGKWLANNAHKYGFIIRYPKGKEKITGYDYEPWHLRYVGKAAAKEIYEKEITLEEYLGEE